MARHQFAVIALAAIAIASAFWILLDQVNVLSKEVQGFGVAAFEKRFDLLRKDLPPHSVIGYVSDNPLADQVTSQGEFYLTQYTLVPTIVKPSTEEPLEVANFHNDKLNEEMLKAKHLVAVKNYGSYVYTYRNTTK